jgi:hypothetical protein
MCVRDQARWLFSICDGVMNLEGRGVKLFGATREVFWMQYTVHTRAKPLTFLSRLCRHSQRFPFRGPQL